MGGQYLQCNGYVETENGELSWVIKVKMRGKVNTPELSSSLVAKLGR
jgi:hypothetical protein